jgi:hypothetical protein
MSAAICTVSSLDKCMISIVGIDHPVNCNAIQDGTEDQNLDEVINLGN